MDSLVVDFGGPLGSLLTSVFAFVNELLSAIFNSLSGVFSGLDIVLS